MSAKGKKTSRVRKWIFGSGLLLLVLILSGCQTIAFYAQAIKGQYRLMADREPISKLVDNPKTPPDLKQQLELVQSMRQFAEKELKLPVDGHYLKYVDVRRPFVVWNVEAAQEFSLEPKSWWYPVVGSLEYRGYFSEKAARKYAAWLKDQEYDVFVGGVGAYSTLGWFKDPVLNTFVFNPEPDLAETIFHELGHQRVFARGDMDFNEAFATTVGEEGARRWLKAKGDQAIQDNYQAQLKRTREFVHLVITTRNRLEVLYGDDRTETGRVEATDKNRDVPRETLRTQKQQLLAQLREDFAKMKEGWGGQTEYDSWMANEVNNAKINAVAAYYELVPAFEHLLHLNGGDMEKFYQAAERLAGMPRKERHGWLNNFKSLHNAGPAEKVENN